MKTLWIALLVAVCFANSAAAEPIKLTIGQTRLLSTPEITRVALGDGALAEVRVLDEQEEVLLIGRASGVTDLRLWFSDGRREHRELTVNRGGSDPSTAILTYLVDGIAGVRLVDINDVLLVSGSPASPEDQKRLDQLLENYPDLANFTEVTPADTAPTIRIEARFVEIRKNALEQIGLDWNTRSPAISFSYASDLIVNDFFRGDFPGLPGNDQLPLDIGTSTRFLGVGLSLSAFIDLLGQAGDANIIAEPMLSTVSGSNAEFKAGGEVPFPVQGADGETTVEFKEYGILLKVAPEAETQDLISTQIEVEVSDIDPSVAVLGLPGFTVRNASTHMRGPSGQTLIIAGLIDSKNSTVMNQVPGLSRLPVLGHLFRSTRFRNDETELVVMVTPYLETDDSPTIL
ncbi:MAG: pilus assembly protein N-terminal domain-containing protein, partial [Gammaproteobacteria bacterium]|nr:pilus assembly protein N-terminal domain-containing protein [Gammaproteobacteria bacterium]